MVTMNESSSDIVVWVADKVFNRIFYIFKNHVFEKVIKRLLLSYSFVPILPSLIGAEDARIVLGKGSGEDSISYWLSKLGLDASHEQIVVLVKNVKELSMKKKGLINESDFRELANATLREN